MPRYSTKARRFGKYSYIGLKEVVRMVTSILLIRCLCYKPERINLFIQKLKLYHFYNVFGSMSSYTAFFASGLVKLNWQMKYRKYHFSCLDHKLLSIIIEDFNSSSFHSHPGNKSSRDPIPDQVPWSLSSTTMEDRLRHASDPVHISVF